VVAQSESYLGGGVVVRAMRWESGVIETAVNKIDVNTVVE
jgi:hypothetical protein